MLARLHFGLRGCVGEGTQDTDRVEFKQTAAERGRCSRSGHLMRLPMLLKKSILSLVALIVSAATGTNKYDWVSDKY